MSNGGIGRRGVMLVLSSPSGAGKTTISRLLLECDDNLTMSVSVTTRPKRRGEVEGIDYRFVDPTTFNLMVNRQEFLESAKVFDHYYGTPREPVEASLAAGRDVLFDIDWQGTQQLVANAARDVATVFILPPSTAELERRLNTRAQDPPEVVAARMSKAADEISHYPEYTYIIVNSDIEESVAQVRSVLAAERLKRDRLTGLGDMVKALREGQ
ncbi:MAG: guanylate kinase [Alphaproteobacteria bacterium]|nr:guanylate kinase [Pseudomonadota bacterium]TDI65481.1 MAG: guanylate kinase [Alphaproteobacteria bacterium]